MPTAPRKRSKQTVQKRSNGKAGPRTNSRVKFDEIDLAILTQLQRNCKITNADLAKQVGISPPSTLERVKKLEHSGIISDHVALVDPKRVGKSILAIVHVSINVHGQKELDEFGKAVKGFDGVLDCWHTAGEDDFILRVLATDMTAYEHFVVHELSAIGNLSKIRTSFCMSTVKQTTEVPLDAAGS